MDIIESLNDVKYQPDLWDELNQELSTKMVLVNFSPRSETTVRLIGPFQFVKRLYMEYSGHLLSKKEAYDIANGDVKVYDIVLKRVKDYLGKTSNNKTINKTIPSNAMLFNPSTGLAEKDLVAYLERLYTNPYWQKCLMINAWVKSANNSFGDFGDNNDLKICCLTQKICGSMIQRDVDINHLRTLPISGILAHDVTIKRSGQALDTKYEMRFSQDASYLDNNIVKTIVQKGLWDFNEVVHELNASNSKYLFKVSRKYRMPEELNNFILYSYDNNEGEHFAAVENEIGDLPDEAIEGKTIFNNTIQSLEI